MHVVEWKSAIRTDLGLKQSPIPERQVMPIMQGTFQPVEKLTVSFTLLVVKRANRPHIPIHKTQVTEILAQSQCMRGNRASIRQSATRRNIRRGDIARGVSGESISVCMVNLCAERNQRTRHQQKTYYAGTIFHGTRWNPFNPSSHSLPSTTYKQRSRSRVTFVIFPATPRPNLPPFTPFPCLRWGGNREWPEKSAFRRAPPRSTFAPPPHCRRTKHGRFAATYGWGF